MARQFLLLVLLLGSLAAEETYVPFRSDLPAGTAYRIDAHRLHPTQFSHGWREVVAKQKAFDAMTATEMTAYLKEKDVPVVIGPGGVPYMTDGHHTMRALLGSEAPDKTAYGHILANWSGLNPEIFWDQMRANNYTYLKDAAGRGPLSPQNLPESLLLMQRDAWRGLAWGVMKAGGFEETKVFFQEFFWADYFRDKVQWDDRDDAAFANAVKAASSLARAPAAAHLPGYRLDPSPALSPAR